MPLVIMARLGVTRFSEERPGRCVSGKASFIGLMKTSCVRNRPSWSDGLFDLPEFEAEDDLDTDDEDDDFEGLRPATWIPGVVPAELLVARSEQAAVVVSRPSAYPEGFELTVKSYVRRSTGRGRRRHLHHPMMWHDAGERGGAVPDEVLRFGVARPDGGRATSLDDWCRHWPDATEPAHRLESQSGGGSDREYSQEYWAWPLPGTGPLQFVTEWPAFGIDETTVWIDGSLLADAATRARPVWSEDADKASHHSRGAVMRIAREHHRPADGFGDL